MPTHYETLGVPEDASATTIREAYVRLAKANHPDRRQQDDPARRARADATMKAANAAWTVLRDPERRAAYDASLRPTTTQSPGRASSSRPDGAPSYAASGVVVPAAHAPFLRYLPALVVAVVLIAILVFSAIETSKATPDPGGPPPTRPEFEVGSCVLVAALPTGPSPVRVACGTGNSAEIVQVVATPRPCPPDSAALDLDDNRTSLCLRSAR